MVIRCVAGIAAERSIKKIKILSKIATSPFEGQERIF
jgi:hypothetical protein